MANGDDATTEREEIIQVKSELHSLTKSFYAFIDEFKEYRKSMQPKQLGIGAIVGIIASGMAIIAMILTVVVYISSSSIAPLSTQQAQTTQILANLQNNTMQNANQNQLTRIELSGLAKSVGNTEDTLRWMLFEENLPKKIIETQGRLNTIEMQMDRVVNQIHDKKE